MEKAKTITKKAQKKIASSAKGVSARVNKYRSKRPHKTFRLTKWVKRQLGGKPVSPILPLIFDSFSLIWKERKLLLGIALVYALVNFVLIGGVSQVDFLDLKDTAVQVFRGDIDEIGQAIALFTAAMSGVLTQPPNQLQQFLGVFVAFLFWLAFIWALRMRFAKEKVNIRDALYNSSAPLISSVMVAGAIVVQILPGAIGLFVFAMAQQIGAIQHGIEYAMFALGAGLLCVLSLYWVVSSALALVVVTLPQMYPWRALSSASELVVGQRWKLVLRVLVLFGVVSVLWAVIFVPTLILDSWLRWDWLPLVPVIIPALGAFTLTYCATYIYKLYRSLL